MDSCLTPRSITGGQTSRISRPITRVTVACRCHEPGEELLRCWAISGLGCPCQLTLVRAPSDTTCIVARESIRSPSNQTIVILDPVAIPHRTREAMRRDAPLTGYSFVNWGHLSHFMIKTGVDLFGKTYRLLSLNCSRTRGHPCGPKRSRFPTPIIPMRRSSGLSDCRQMSMRKQYGARSTEDIMLQTEFRLVDNDQSLTTRE